ncbi:hypothetical protein M0804_008922 [Polistes exclamans]|nr:hypothetical protein M0804_008922 [Polistes exclamans]
MENGRGRRIRRRDDLDDDDNDNETPPPSPTLHQTSYLLYLTEEGRRLFKEANNEGWRTTTITIITNTIASPTSPLQPPQIRTPIAIHIYQYHY